VTVELNHTIVWCRDQKASASFLTEMLGLPEAVPFGPFLVVELGNGVSMDFHEVDGEIASQHYAFIVSEDEFAAIHGRIVERGLDHWADPMKQHRGEINHHDGGRGVYWDAPDGHLLEIITVPYGGWPG
jgi:catechol 2,3-dioxygenase-like lactoylglutathione lyase family enzyme